MKKLIFTGIFALALTAVPASATEIFVRFGPPRPPREVVVVSPGPGYVWVPGHYRWAGKHYKWTRGRWVKPPRHHAVWVPGYWAPRRGGFVWIAGYWR
ncbi:MAG: YXWGXW repeat-containing protein [Rhodospirillales bacterium]